MSKNPNFICKEIYVSKHYLLVYSCARKSFIAIIRTCGEYCTIKI